MENINNDFTIEQDICWKLNRESAALPCAAQNLFNGITFYGNEKFKKNLRHYAEIFGAEDAFIECYTLREYYMRKYEGLVIPLRQGFYFIHFKDYYWENISKFELL